MIVRHHSTSRRGLVLALAALILAALAAPSSASYERPGRTIRVSVSSTGEQADVDTSPPKFIPNSKGYINETGRYVTFEAWAPNLVEEDREGILRPHSYRHDLLTGETVRVSLRWDGRKNNGGGRGAQQSADGRYIGFSSSATDMDEELDTARGTDVYVRDMELGVTEKITVAPDGSNGSNGSPINLNNSHFVDISPTGRYVVFGASMTNLTEEPDANGTIQDVFLRDRETDKTEIVSLSSSDQQLNDPSVYAAITENGEEVIFESWATDVVDHPVGPEGNLYLRNRRTGTTEFLEIGGPGVVPDGDVALGGISNDGRFVLFNSGATNLVPHDDNQEWDAFVHDRLTGRTERVSVATNGDQADLGGYGWEISADGRYVTIDSDATNLVTGDTNLRGDAFVRDRLLGTTRRISVASDGTQGNRTAGYSSISADGSIAAFDSTATNLVEGDTNEEKDIFVRFLGPDVGFGELDAELADGSVQVSGWSGFAGAVAGQGSDPEGDNPEASTDLIGASVINRPEDGSVQLRWDVAELNPLGAPGIIFGAEFGSAGAIWEIRGMPTIYGLPRFHLMRCETTCTRVSEVHGRYGREGSVVTVTIPDTTEPFTPGTELTNVSLYTSPGEGLVVRAADLDSVVLGTVVLAVPEISFGLAPSGSDAVTYGAPLVPEQGRFSAVVDLEGADPDGLDLWARACLGDACSIRILPLGDGTQEPVQEPTAMTLEFVKGKGSIQALATLKTATGIAIEGRTITVYLNGAPVGTAVTDTFGVVTWDLHRKDAKPGDVVQVTFAGDDGFLGSSAERTITPQDL